MVPSFLFLRRVVFAFADLEEAKNLAGESPPPDSDLFDDAGVLKRSRRSVNTIRRKLESPIPIPEMQSALHPHAQ
jgi:hypothetical protein